MVILKIMISTVVEDNNSPECPDDDIHLDEIDGLNSS